MKSLMSWQAVVALGMILGTQVNAQDKLTGSIGFVFALPSDQWHEFMCSVIKDGVIVAQTEGTPNKIVLFNDIPVGVYDLRAESASEVTVVKRGITVTAGRTNNVQFPRRVVTVSV